MNAREKEEAILRYNRRLARFGVGEKALGWGGKGRSRLRNEILLSQWDVRGRRVLDFGCGFGGLVDQLEARGVPPSRYLGVDINPRLIDEARKLHPRARFEVLDLLEDRRKLSVDYTFSSGVFNHRLRDNKGFIRRCFERFDRISRRGFAANFLSSRVEYRLKDTYHADPAEILDLAYRFSNNVVLRNDYMPYEFTVFVNKAARVDPRLTVYEEFVKLA